MLGNTKPTASLSSGLLARKGQARPAMRPQGFVGLSHTPLDDLGWNDMGHDAPAATPVPHPSAPSHADPEAEQAVPPVVRQREALEEEYAPPAEPEEQAEDVHHVDAPEAFASADAGALPATAPVAAPVAAVRPVSNATAARIDREVRTKRHKAAFTLRLDSDRHLRLRLAAAVCGQSAQQLVTEALDAFLESVPEVEALVSQLPRRAGR